MQQMLTEMRDSRLTDEETLRIRKCQAPSEAGLGDVTTENCARLLNPLKQKLKRKQKQTFCVQ
jgi:hypothetical protein